MKKIGASILVLIAYLLWVGGAFALKSHHPTVWAHGMAGFDSVWYILDDWYYWGDDTGASVIDSCQTLEAHCNDDIFSTQWGFHDSKTGWNTPVYRGLQQANQIQNYLAGLWHSDEDSQTDYGLARGDKIHIIGHSQGGIDARKAAKELYARSFNIRYEHRYLQSEWLGTFSYTQTRYKNLPANTIKVDHIVSVASPHRGSSIADAVLGWPDAVNFVVDSLIQGFYGLMGWLQSWPGGSDVDLSLKSLQWSNGTSNDSESFNASYPGTDGLYARKHISFVFAQQGNFIVDVLDDVLNYIAGDIDGFNYLNQTANGNPAIRDDDGLVGVSSARMGYQKCFDGSLNLSDSGTGFTVLNSPTATQKTSMTCVYNQDHLDVISFPETGGGPEWDEMRFAAAIVNYLDANEDHIGYYNFDGHYQRDDAHNY